MRYAFAPEHCISAAAELPDTYSQDGYNAALIIAWGELVQQIGLPLPDENGCVYMGVEHAEDAHVRIWSSSMNLKPEELDILDTEPWDVWLRANWFMDSTLTKYAGFWYVPDNTKR